MRADARAGDGGPPVDGGAGPSPDAGALGPVVDDGRAPGRAVGRPGGPITCGAELVVLAEAAQVRLFRLTGVFVLVGSVLAVVFGSGSADDPGLVTALAALVGGVAALVVVARPLPAYLALRADRRLRLAVVAATSTAVLSGGVDGPSWWVALGVVLLLSAVSSMRFAMTAAFVVAIAYVVGSLLAGGTLARNGIDAGIVAGASGLPLYALVMRVVTEGFARVLLMLHRSATASVRGLPVAPRPPLRADGSPWVPGAPATGSEAPSAPAVTVGSATVEPAVGPATTTADGATPARAVGRGRSARMTVRQLEVALLARDGLLQAEIAEALAISVTQVERHLRQGRERAGAATVGELLGVLVEDGIIGPPSHDVAAATAAA